MHHDARRMPTRRSDWGPFNYLLSPQCDRPIVGLTTQTNLQALDALRRASC